MKEKIKKAAKDYAEENNGAYTYDYYGFVAGAEWALGLKENQTEVALPGKEGVYEANLLVVGYECIRPSEEGIDAIWQKGGFRVFVGWDTDHVYLPALSVVGMAMRGPVVGYLSELEMFEKIWNKPT
jgi:hypothetical protein